MHKSLTIIFLLVSAAVCQNYTGFKVFEVTTSTKDHVNLLHQWNMHTSVDFWTFPHTNKMPARIMVGPDVEQTFVEFLIRHSIPFVLKIDNVEKMLREEKRVNEKHRRSKKEMHAVEDATFDHYWTFDEMETYANLLAGTYPRRVKLEIIGKSSENRNIFALKISNNLSNFGEKPIIFIDAGIHAREWASHACALYLIHQLVTSEFSREMLEKVDWVIIPNVNPDGYVYSQTKDSLWRKNRRVINSECTGVDLNRNFPFEFDNTFANCSKEEYPGISPLSEPESIAIAKYMESFNHNLKLYVATHAFSAFVLWPFAFESGQHIWNWREHDHVAKLFVSAVRSAGNQARWDVGNTVDKIGYESHGNTQDFAIAYAASELALVIELPPNYPSPSEGFQYPPSKIERLVREIFMGYRAMGLYVGDAYSQYNSIEYEDVE